MRGAWLLALAFGCAPPEDPTGLACETSQVAVELAPPGGEFGELTDGAEVEVGYPPQGGAPYSPFLVRFTGPKALSEGVLLNLVALDAADGSLLGSTEVAVGLICANAGSNRGFWYGGEAHLRYDGWSVPELDGRDAELLVDAISLSAVPVETESEAKVRLTTE